MSYALGGGISHIGNSPLPRPSHARDEIRRLANQAAAPTTQVLDPYTPPESDGPIGSFVISSRAVALLLAEVDYFNKRNLVSALAYQYFAISDRPDAVGAKIARKVEDMFVSIGYGAQQSGERTLELSEAGTFDQLVSYEFLRRFPVSPANMATFMIYIHVDLANAYGREYKIYGEWGELKYDEASRGFNIETAAD